MRRIVFALLAATGLLAAAESADIYSAKELDPIAAKLAKGNPTFRSEQLKKYPAHYTMLAHREASGSSEMHEHEADFFIIEDGEASLITGGKLVNSHVEKAGELRGTSIQGGEKRSLAKGDIVHIPAGVAHQMLLEKGKQVTYFVLKVTGQ